MWLFDKLKKKNEIVEKEDLENNKKIDNSLIEMNNYMLSDVRK